VWKLYTIRHQITPWWSGSFFFFLILQTISIRWPVELSNKGRMDSNERGPGDLIGTGALADKRCWRRSTSSWTVTGGPGVGRVAVDTTDPVANDSSRRFGSYHIAAKLFRLSGSS